MTRKDYITEPARKLPVIDEFDVVIVGGGIAGVAAAVAASRNDARVCIIEKENALGGLATLGLIAIYLPLCDGMGNQVIAGLGEELLKLSLQYGPGEIPAAWKDDLDKEKKKEQRYRVNFNPASYMISLEELILENNIELFYDSRFCGLDLKNDEIKAVIIENKSGRLAVKGKSFIDATGDADLSYQAGEETVSLATNKRSGWFFSHKDSEVRLHMLHDPLYSELPPGVPTFAGDNGKEVSIMNITARKMIKKRLQEINKDNEKEYEEYPVVIPTIPQFRMTRRIKTSFELDESDDKKYFADSIGMTGDWRKAGPVFHLPYRCIRGEKVNNLLVAGRCISVTTSAWDITRAIPTCVVTGQAAGTAAALSSIKNINARELDINALQDNLKGQGVIIDRTICD